MYTLGHDLVRLVYKSTLESREPTSGLRLELRQTDRESDVATAEGPRDDGRRMAWDRRSKASRRSATPAPSAVATSVFEVSLSQF